MIFPKKNAKIPCSKNCDFPLFSITNTTVNFNSSRKHSNQNKQNCVIVKDVIFYKMLAKASIGNTILGNVITATNTLLDKQSKISEFSRIFCSAVFAETNLKTY